MKQHYEGFTSSILKQIQYIQPHNTKLGFTLSECIIVAAIVGILTSVALPSYLNQINRTRQNEAAATIAQIQTSIAAYSDEFGELPENWKDLNDISAIMTKDGSADKENFNAVITPNGYYKIYVENNKNEFKVVSTHTENKELYVVGCLNLTNGASSIIKGPKFKNEISDENLETNSELVEEIPGKEVKLAEANDIPCFTEETEGESKENSDLSQGG